MEGREIDGIREWKGEEEAGRDGERTGRNKVDGNRVWRGWRVV